MNQEGGREEEAKQHHSSRREREQERGNPISDPSAPRPRRMLSLRPICSCRSLSLSLSCIIHRMRRRPCVLSRICSDHVTAPTSYVRFSPSKRISHVPVCLQRCSHSKNRVKLAIVDALRGRVKGQGGVRPRVNRPNYYRWKAEMSTGAPTKDERSYSEWRIRDRSTGYWGLVASVGGKPRSGLGFPSSSKWWLGGRTIYPMVT